MSLYRRGRVWWYQFEFQGALIRESSGMTNQEAARDVEIKRKNEFRIARAGLPRKRERVPLFSLATEQWLQARKSDWSEKMHVIESTNVGHLTRHFKNRLLSDIGPDDVAQYRGDRIESGAAPKTVSLELGSLRALLRHFDLDAQWSQIKKKIKFAKAEKKGRVITRDEETALLYECRNSRSRSLYPAVVIAVHTALRYSEIRLLQWRHIDMNRRTITVGRSKSDAGEGRVVPMSTFLNETLAAWIAQFPGRKLDHFVFPSEKYGQPKIGLPAGFYAVDVTQPIGTWKEAWEHAKKRAGVSCRFHDLRHTACTRMLEAGVLHPIVAEIMGWSTSTAIRMIREVYGHVSLTMRQRAIEQVEAFLAAQNAAGYAQKPTRSKGEAGITIQ